MQRAPKQTPPELDFSEYEWFALRARKTSDGAVAASTSKPFLARADMAQGLLALVQAEARRTGSTSSITLFVYRVDPTGGEWQPSWVPYA